MTATPGALQLRLMQTMVEVAAERNSTLVLPFPVELLRYFEAAAHAADPAVPRAGIPDRERAPNGAVPDPASVRDRAVLDPASTAGGAGLDPAPDVGRRPLE